VCSNGAPDEDELETRSGRAIFAALQAGFRPDMDSLAIDAQAEKREQPGFPNRGEELPNETGLSYKSRKPRQWSKVLIHRD